jgi:hypothetical protein
VCTVYTALLDIPKNRFDRKNPTFVFFKYLLYLNICEENRNAIKFICSGVRPAEYTTVVWEWRWRGVGVDVPHV